MYAKNLGPKSLTDTNRGMCYKKKILSQYSGPVSAIYFSAACLAKLNQNKPNLTKSKQTCPSPTI